MLYGPYRFEGAFTTESNAEFDQWLKARDPASGVRDFEAVVAVAETAGLVLGGNQAMPSNNQLLTFIAAPSTSRGLGKGITASPSCRPLSTSA